LVDGKGFPHLVKIMPEVLKRVPNLVWVVIGNGPKRDSIYEDIRKNNLQNVVRYMGDVPHKDIKKYYYLADVFALFTHPESDGREEGLGLVYLEAAACGTAVIAGKSGGVEEAVTHGVTGLVVDVYGDLAGAGQAIVDLIKQKDYREQLGKAAQDRIKAQFIWDEQLKALEKFL
jgi:phosphatidylinositol alpha-1,6-mannosyltransferase